MAVTELERNVVKTVVERFVNLRESTPRKFLIRTFRSLDALDRLSNLGILRKFNRTDEEFLPAPLAFHYAGSTDILRKARTSLEIVLHVLQNMFDVEMEKTEFKAADVEAHAQKMYDVVDPEAIKLGLYLAQDFRVLGGWTSNSEMTELATLRIADNIVTIKDIGTVWDAYVAERSGYIDNPPDAWSSSVGLEESSRSAKASTHSGVLIFISHSSKDSDLALALIELLKAGLGLLADQIRCSSVDGYRLPVGVNTERRLRDEVNAATIVIGLITPSSLASHFVMFELGARWGAGLFLAPLLAGVHPRELTGPLSLLNALSADSEAQLHQLLADISDKLEMPLQNVASYVRHISIVKSLAVTIPNGVAKSPATTPEEAKAGLQLSMGVEGTPPKQMIKLSTNQTVAVSRLEYMLSNETCIAAEDISLQGQALEVPLNHDLLTRLWNTPRPDRNNYDHSGPAKIALHVILAGRTRQYMLPVQMDNFIQNNTYYRKLVGSKTFYSTAEPASEQ